MALLATSDIQALVQAYHDNHDYVNPPDKNKAYAFAAACRGLLNPLATPARLEKAGIVAQIDRSQLMEQEEKALAFIANDGNFRKKQTRSKMVFPNYRNRGWG